MTGNPIVTLLLCGLAGGLLLVPPVAQNVLYFHFDQIYLGKLLGLITGHWIHANFQHLIWNVAALAILGTMIERRSRSLLLWSLLVGTLSVDLLLLSPFSDLQRYCGLSGVLNTLLGVVLYLFWRETRSTLVPLTAVLSLAKIALEMYSGQSVFTEIAWPPFAAAHLAGILGAPLAIILWARERNDAYSSNYSRHPG